MSGRVIAGAKEYREYAVSYQRINDMGVPSEELARSWRAGRFTAEDLVRR